ncbi:hypothetical protein [Nocardia brasiliensis]|uniref:hypothetical protein n=1 Tax=Nocardia brasiliensis TaxID=37326 RepID=UPI0004A6DEBD|nr:hypothetical protein [Nocardia brasiliensis]
MIEIKHRDLDRAVSRAISSYMNGLAPSLPPLWWTQYAKDYRDWSLHGLAEDGDPDAVAAWAAELNLTRVSDPVSPGLVEYSGECSARNITEVVVWCVADRDAYEASVAEVKAAAAEYRAARAAADEGAQR